jgi:hypothetical protein
MVLMATPSAIPKTMVTTTTVTMVTMTVMMAMMATMTMAMQLTVPL